MKRYYHILLAVQGVYYSLTAFWALVHITSFMKITGPKTDTWLVKTVAVTLLAAGLAFAIASFEKRRNMPVSCLACFLAFGLAVIDVNYSVKGVISRIYLVDAAVQVAFLFGWAILFMKKPKSDIYHRDSRE